MGRRPEPTQAKILRGNFRADRDGHGPAVEIKAPACPPWLPKQARKYWREIAPQLEQCGLLGAVDTAAFSAHCDAVGRFEEVTRQLKSLDSMLDSTPQGYLVQSVLFQIRNKLWDQVMRSSQEFGLSPAGRSKVRGVAQQQLPLGGSEWDDV